MVGFTTDDGGVVVRCEACQRRVAVPYGDVGSAVRCGHCAATLPPTAKPVAVRSEAAFDAGRLVVAKVDTDDLPDVAQRFRICSVPTLALFVGGREIFRAPGALPAEGIRDVVARALDR